MANQMIALQARAPQSSGLGGAVQQNAQLINMMMQQKAAERQTAQATQAMQLAQNKEARDVSAAEIDLAGKQIDYHYKRATAVNTPQGYQAWLAGVAKDSPEFAEFFVTNLPPAAFDRSTLIRMVGSVKDNFDATYPKAEASLGYGLKGEMQNVITGGLPGVAGVFPLEEFTLAPPTARTGEVEVGEPTFADGGVGGPDMGANDLAGVASVLSNVANDAEYQAVLNTINNQNPQIAAAIRQAMPRFDPQRMAGIRAAGAQAFGGAGAPDQPGLVAGERGGVGGPYVPTGRQAMGKNPMQAPMPGSAIVPIKRVREEAAAQRVTPTETYSTKRAEKQAQSDVEFLDAYESSKSDAQNILSVIDQMIGDLNIKDGKITQGKRPPHPGFESVIGAGIPGLRFVPGTQSADFDAFMEQVQGGAFLKAYNALRGTGQITEKEGEKATTALSRMKRSQSEAGFVKAAREFEGVVRSAVQRADARAARLRGGASASTRTPVNKSAGGKNRPPLSSFEGR